MLCYVQDKTVYRMKLCFQGKRRGKGMGQEWEMKGKGEERIEKEGKSFMLIPPMAMHQQVKTLKLHTGRVNICPYQSNQHGAYGVVDVLITFLIPQNFFYQGH